MYWRKWFPGLGLQGATSVLLEARTLDAARVQCIQSGIQIEILGLYEHPCVGDQISFK